jgi:hypothetical protein
VFAYISMLFLLFSKLSIASLQNSLLKYLPCRLEKNTRLRTSLGGREGAFQGILTLSQRLSQPSVSLTLNITGRSLRSLNIRVNVCIASFTAIMTTVEPLCLLIAAKFYGRCKLGKSPNYLRCTKNLTTHASPALHNPTVTGKITFC